MNLRDLLLVLAAVFFGLVGFGITAGSEHFSLLPLGFLALTLALLVEGRNLARRL